MKDTKLQGKDLIHIGIYAAIYCALVTVIAMLGYIPVMMVLLTVIGPVLGGIPMMLFFTKVKKFGMITIMGIIIGIYFMIAGMGIWPAICGVIFGFLADLVAKSGNYVSAGKMICSYGVWCVIVYGNFLPLFINREAYFSTRQSFGQEYIDTLSNLLPTWMAPVLLVLAVVSGMVGGLLGKKIMNKHFVKAGIV